MPTVVKLLSGELISTEATAIADIVSDIRRIYEEKPGEKPGHIQLIPCHTNDSNDSTDSNDIHVDYLAFVSIAKHFHIPNKWRRYAEDTGKWMRDVINESVLRHIVSTFGSKLPPAPFFANPHPIAVDVCLKMTDGLRSDREEMRLLYFNMNPSETVVEFLLDPVNADKVIWNGMCGNPNPRIQAYLHAHKDKITLNGTEMLFENANANPELLSEAFEFGMSTGRIRIYSGNIANHPVMVEKVLAMIRDPQHVVHRERLYRFVTKCSHPEALSYVLQRMDSVIDRHLQNGFQPSETVSTVKSVNNIHGYVNGDDGMMCSNPRRGLEQLNFMHAVNFQDVEFQAEDLVVDWYLRPDRAFFRRQDMNRNLLVRNPHPKLVHHYIQHPEECDFLARIMNTHPDAIEQCKDYIRELTDEQRLLFFDAVEEAPAWELVAWILEEYGETALPPYLILLAFATVPDEKVVIS